MKAFLNSGQLCLVPEGEAESELLAPILDAVHRGRAMAWRGDADLNGEPLEGVLKIAERPEVEA